jgi:hypothetical protein
MFRRRPRLRLYDWPIVVGRALARAPRAAAAVPGR